MEQLTLEQIKTMTLSTEITTANAVYEIKVGVYGRNPKNVRTEKSDMYHFREGELVCVSGCGELDEKRGETQVFVGDTWYWVHNSALVHKYNDILMRVG